MKGKIGAKYPSFTVCSLGKYYGNNIFVLYYKSLRLLLPFSAVERIFLCLLLFGYLFPVGGPFLQLGISNHEFG